MFALLLCLMSIFTPGFGQMFEIFNASLSSPDLHFNPDLKSQCSVQLVFADDKNRRLTTWSPEENCQKQDFLGYPPIMPENIYQCNNGITFIKGQDPDGFTRLTAYIGEKWEPVILPPEIRDVTNYAVASVPDIPGLFLVGGKVEYLNNGALNTIPVDIICLLDCFAFAMDGSKDGSDWICYDQPNVLCNPTYDSCATSSNEFLTVINGKEAPSAPVKDVGFYPAFGRPRSCEPDSVDFMDGVEDCITVNTTQVYAIGTKELYLMDPAEGSVKLQKGALPVVATPAYPARLFYTPENSAVNVIGGTEKGKPSCNTFYYNGKNKWKKGAAFPCEAGRVLGTL